MLSLKDKLNNELQKYDNSQNDLDALPRKADIITQCKAIDKWHNAWVKDACRGKLTFGKPKQTNMNTSALGKRKRDVSDRVQSEAVNELFKKRDMLCILSSSTEVNKLKELLCQNASNWTPPSLPASPLRSSPWGASIPPIFLDVPPPLDYLISLEGYQNAVREFTDYLRAHKESNGYLMPDSLWIISWFTTKLFVRLIEPDNNGRVLVSSLMDYVFKKLDYYRLRLNMMMYDTTGTGYISKKKLELNLRLMLGGGSRDGPVIRSFVGGVVSETFFLLNSLRNKKVKIAKLLGSRLLPQLRPDFMDGQMYKRFMTKLSVFNAFVKNNAYDMIPLSVFYEKLPEISVLIWQHDERVKEKKVRFLLPVLLCIIHLTAVATSAEKENKAVTFQMFLEITNAWEYLDSCYSSIAFFFRALDTDDKGYLDEMDLRRHFRNIEDVLKLRTGRRSYSHSPSSNDRNWLTPSFVYIQEHIKHFLVRERISHLTPENL